MTSGPPLHLPPAAIGTLTHAYTGRYSDCSRIGVYYLSSSGLTAASITSLCESITSSYAREFLREDELGDSEQFLAPITTSFASAQECLEHHLNTLDEWLVEHPPPDREVAMYPYGILVFTQKDEDPLLIHADRINRYWHLGSIYMPTPDLALNLTSLIMSDQGFGDMCNGYNVKVPQNDPAIDQNYKEHVKDETGVWKTNAPRFAVFATGCDRALPVQQDMLDDEFEDSPFSHRNAELYGTSNTEDKNDLRVKFLRCVAADQKGEGKHTGQGPCSSCRPLHKHIFIEIDNAEPRAKGVLVCKMEWDGVTEDRTDEQLAEIGRSAKIETTRTGAAFAVATAISMSKDDNNHENEDHDEKD